MYSFSIEAFLREGDGLSKGTRLIGELIYDYRKSRRYTLPHLSTLSGIPKGTISKIERGETKHPELTTILALTSSLSIPYSDVVGHYIVTERRKNVLKRLLMEAIQRSESTVIEKIAARFLQCDSEDSYDLVEELYIMTEAVTDNTIRLTLFALIAKYAREHGVQPYVAKAFFQTYLIERNDFSRLEQTFHTGIYLLNYIDFFPEEEKALIHFKLGFHAYALQMHEKSIELLSAVVEEYKSDPLTRARALLLTSNSYYYLGNYFLAEHYMHECNKYSFKEIQENIKLNEACILGKKGHIEQAISQLLICLQQSSSDQTIHIINELFELYLHNKDLVSINMLLKKYESQIINTEYKTPFKKSELALYFKLKAGYYIQLKKYEEAIDCFMLSILHYIGVDSRVRANDCFNLILFILPKWAQQQVDEST
ncbi:helix-turn-helix transcriptional regulator [Paenibacillus alvei]|uniref:helix-turn-helix transcriptional regulator n=1 Tax=Paenibacillus alvei TaxID=44250 RepID=UPI00227F8F1F|nr:helix-turn-helix transcriptional regulator [Paenibacillus alvei]MCY7486928.1 helix-turn-helix transcriptional regulator [Paenibacillus alvei]